MSTINSFNAGFGGVSASYTAPKAVEAAAENKTEGKVENTSSQKTPDVDTYEKTQKRLSADQLKAIQKPRPRRQNWLPTESVRICSLT